MGVTLTNDDGGVSGSYAFGLLMSLESNCVWMLAIGGPAGAGEREGARALNWLFVRSGLRGGTMGGFV